jgi:hypothetical protein
MPSILDRHVPASQRGHAVGCRGADRWVSMPNGAHLSRRRGRFRVEVGPTPALWRFACRGERGVGT